MSDPNKPDAPTGTPPPSDSTETAPALPLVDRVLGWLEKIEAAAEPLRPEEGDA